MAAVVWKFLSLCFGQVAWLEGKILLSCGRCLGSVLDAKCDFKKKKKVNGMGWNTFFALLGIFRHLRWYLQLLLWKQSGKEEQLVGGSCLLWPSLYEDSGEIKALTGEWIVWCLVLDAGLPYKGLGSWLCPPSVLLEVMWFMSEGTGWWQPRVYMVGDSASVSLGRHLSLRHTNALWVGLEIPKPGFSDDRGNIQSFLV